MGSATPDIALTITTAVNYTLCTAQIKLLLCGETANVPKVPLLQCKYMTALPPKLCHSVSSTGSVNSGAAVKAAEILSSFVKRLYNLLTLSVYH